LENISVIYMPIYYYVSALLAGFTGVSFTPLRIISFSASIGIGLLIFLAVKRETASNFFAMIATGIFAASFKLTSGWYDIARTDMLAMFFTFAALLSLRSENKKVIFISGILFAAAFYTKQTTLAFFLFVLAYILIFERSKLFWLVLSFFIAFAIGWGILSAQNGEWLYYYTFTLPANNALEINRGVILRGLQYLLIPLSFVMVILMIWFSSHVKEIFISPSRRYYLLITLAATGISMLAYFNRGGWTNNLISAFISYAILFGIALDSIAEHIGKEQNPLAGNIYLCLLWFGCIAQFVTLAYNPNSQIPTDEDWQAGHSLVKRISAVNGDVLVPRQNYLALLAGKEPFIHHMGLTMINGGFGNISTVEGQELEIEINQAIRDGRFAAIILDSADEKIEKLLGCFKKDVIEYESDDSFFPIEGDESRPIITYTPCQNQN